MNVAYFDCFAGASGDMILGALIDAGLDADALRERLSLLPLREWDWSVRRVNKRGIAATSVEVVSREMPVERRLAEIEALIGESGLPEHDRIATARIFRRLAEAEARVHGIAAGDVHFHEVGAVDAIVDVVGAVVGLGMLGVERVHASPLPLGRGFVQAAHGTLPLPAPAVVELLRGLPAYGAEADGETVTPTAAAILSTLGTAFGPLPAMRLQKVGYGAGRREAEYPNALRVLIGEAEVEPDAEPLVVVETNIDDLSPQVYDHLMGRLLDAGALDVWLAPIQMKKNRPGVLVSMLCAPEAESRLTDILFRETTTLGVRRQAIERRRLGREMREVQTRFGAARVKVAFADGRPLRALPEYDDCKRLAESLGLPLRNVLVEVERAASALLDRETVED